MSTINYLSTNNLPCRYWLDARNTSSVNLTAVDFSWNSSYGDNVSFTTTDFNNLPTIQNNTISLDINVEISSPSINYDFPSYTILYLGKHLSLTTEEKLLSLGDFELDYSGVTATIKHSRLGYLDNNPKTAPYLAENKPILAVSHNTKSKYVELLQFNEDNSILNTRLAYEAHNRLNNKTPILKGPKTNLSHILFFTPRITTVDITNIINLLIQETPALADNLIWDNINTVAWNNITTALWEGIR